MMTLTPGLRMLFNNSHTLIMPPLFVYLIANLQEEEVRPFILISAYIFSVPGYLYLSSIFRSWAFRGVMSNLRAQDVPLWAGKLPGNADIAITMYRNWMNGYPGDGLDEATEELGMTFKTRIFGVDQVWTSDPRNIKTILSTDADGYDKGERYITSMDTVLGHGILNSDGETYQLHRAMTKPSFHKNHISDFRLFGKYADDAISQAKTRLCTGHPIDIQDMFLRYTLDTTTDFIYGSSIDSLDAGLPYPPAVDEKNPRHQSDVFSRAFASAQHKLGGRQWAGPVWPLLETFGDSTADDNEVIDGFIGPIVNDGLAKRALREKVGIKVDQEAEEYSLLSSLLTQTNNYKVLRDETFNVLLAARNPVASLLTSVFYCFSQHPQVMTTLRQEIMDKIGPSRPPTTRDLKEMRYLRAVLDETLRLFPPKPFSVRETTRATTWLANKSGERPYYLPTKTTCVISAWQLHRNKNLWGPDAMEFDPDRWLDARLHQFFLQNPSIFLPFNEGPRVCLGQQFAYNQASFMLIRLLQHFESVQLAYDAQPAWSRPPAQWKEFASNGRRKGKEEFWPKTHLSMYSYGGLWVELQEPYVY